MEAQAKDLDVRHGQSLARASEVKAHRQQCYQNQARRDWRAFEVFHFAAVIAQLTRGHVVTGQPADTAGDEHDQNEQIEAAAQAQTITQDGRSDAETDDVSERIELLAEGRVLAVPARHSAIGDIKE